MSKDYIVGTLRNLNSKIILTAEQNIWIPFSRYSVNEHTPYNFYNPIIAEIIRAHRLPRKSSKIACLCTVMMVEKHRKSLSTIIKLSSVPQDQTRRERLKSASKENSLYEKLTNMSKLPKGVFRARLTLQKFGYSVPGHMRAFSEPRPPAERRAIYMGYNVRFG